MKTIIFTIIHYIKTNVFILTILLITKNLNVNKIFVYTYITQQI